MHLTHLSPRIIQFGVLFSSWSASVLSEVQNIDHVKQDLNSCWNMTNQELVNGAIASGLNDCCNMLVLRSQAAGHCLR